MIGYFPNRTSVQSQTSGGDWQLLATDGVGYASHAALLDAGKTVFTQDVAPQGVALLIVQTVSSAETAAGATVQLATNTLSVPTAAQHLVIGTLPPLEIPGPVKSVWIKKTTSGDKPLFTGLF